MSAIQFRYLFLKRIIQHFIALSELSWRKIFGSFDLIMSQNRGEYSCLFTFKRDKHHLNSRTGQCRQNSIPNLIFRQKFPNFYPKQETKSINDYIQRHSFPFLIMPHSHMIEMRWSRDDFGRYLLKDTRETYIPFDINAIMTYQLEWQATLQQNGHIDVGDEMCWWQVWDADDRFNTLKK